MNHELKIILAASLMVLFGLFLLWQGLTGNVVKSSAGSAILPRWIYILGGIGMLLLPGAYLVLMVFIID